MIKNYEESIEIYYNPNWSYKTGSPSTILIIGSELGRTNVLLNLISINNQILTKFIFTSKIHLIEKKYELKY